MISPHAAARGCRRRFFTGVPHARARHLRLSPSFRQTQKGALLILGTVRRQNLVGAFCSSGQYRSAYILHRPSRRRQSDFSARGLLGGILSCPPRGFYPLCRELPDTCTPLPHTSIFMLHPQLPLQRVALTQDRSTHNQSPVPYPTPHHHEVS